MAKITQEREKCIGCGACVGACPDFWEMMDDGKAMLLNSKADNKTKNYELEVQDPGCCKNAAESCPMTIIHVQE